MIIKRRKTRPSFAPDGSRIGSSSSSACSGSSLPISRMKVVHNKNRLFQSGEKLTVQRASFMPGLSLLHKKFQRPMQGRRAYKGEANAALKKCTLGPKKRTDGMKNLMKGIGRPLHFVAKRRDDKGDTDSCSNSEDEEEEAEDRPFEPLMVWQSPHQGGPARGLPSQLVSQVQTDEYGVEETVTTVQPAPMEKYNKEDVFVPPVLAKWLRPHQREGVNFMYQCVMGLKNFKGNGCILADDMGLGKTLQSVTLIYTLLKTGITSNGAPTAKRVIVVCPCSLVKNWDNEFVKWLGPGTVKTLALAEADRSKVQKDLDAFVKTRLFNVLICSYECLRAHVGRLIKHGDCCDLLVCDEAHRLKNNENQTSRALNSLPVKRRVLLTGTPMQNDLQEFFAMVDFTNPGVLGTQEEFRKRMLFPILRGREPDATESQKKKMMDIQNDMSTTVNEFILRRINTLNAEHLPPKLVQVVCCNLTEIQQNMYQHLITSKDMQHVMDGKQVNCLGSIQMLMKLSNHPSLVAEDDATYGNQQTGRRAAAKQVKYIEDDEPSSAAPGADGIAKFLPFSSGGGRGGPVHPEWSGKMFVLYRLMKEMRRPGNGNDKIVIVSNYTQTLDLIGRMCRENSWGFCRLDGSITMKKRQKMVDEFNDPSSPLIAFLLSSKAGGCGLNLIGGNRLVLFDPDWNPAVDKQAAARCWRDGQKKRCFTYRFLATGTVEEKIFQRQLSKEGLQSVVDDKQQVNALSTKDLRNLFKLRTGTPSDTHDKLRCERCKIIHDDAEAEALKVLPKQLAACIELVDEMTQHEDASFFQKPLLSQDHGVSKEAYEKVVKQPMDLGTVRDRLKMSQDQPSAYKSVSSVSKDVNRIFSNVMKVWAPGDPIADASRRLQSWWIEKWTDLVPRLMVMKSEETSQADVRPDSEMAALEGCSTLLNNERGDDYQEQIGMPDEENMRHWSHHHTTDTVDDPVFRAAMRGTDSVSFVFGLEVTWSLIQQRQQEEEERQAMEELEGIEELQKEEEDKEAESDVDVKPDIGERDVDSDVQMEAGSDDDEDHAGNEQNGDTSKSGYSNNEDKDRVGSDTSDDSVIASQSPGAKIASPSLTGDSSGTEIEAETLPSCSTPGSNKENETSPSKNEWECPTCTLFNRKIKKKCNACGTARPKKRSIDQVE
eukprot:scaffold14741_cov135-Cylindrotheca_fusiformis.AAC.9